MGAMERYITNCCIIDRLIKARLRPLPWMRNWRNQTRTQQIPGPRGPSTEEPCLRNVAQPHSGKRRHRL